MIFGRRTAVFLLVGGLLAVPVRSAESIAFSVSLVVDETGATTAGGAAYTAPSMCLDCRHWGNHRLNGGSASASWNLAAVSNYQGTLEEFVPTQPTCYVGSIEGWGSAGFYGNRQSAQYCTPCVLYVEADGSGSISGASSGRSTHTCGTLITLTAAPANGWVFVRWSGSISTTSATISFTLDASKSLTAFFEPGSPPSSGTDPADKCDGETGYGNPCSPILINLSDGPWRLSGIDDPVLFDIDADGQENRITWTARGEPLAFVALDRNANGIIDDGGELFGTATRLPSGKLARNGFEASKELDLNHDEIVDGADPGWGALLLWVDGNHDGVSQSAELTALPESGVMALRTTYHTTNRIDPSGNRFRYFSTLVQQAGRRPYYDVFFRSAPGH